jgi:sulfate adenylyltransferase
VELKEGSRDCKSWDLTPRQLCDLELLLNGGFSPLRGFMTRADYEAVCDSMRLAEGALWPIPVMLDVPEEFAGTLENGARVALRDAEGVISRYFTWRTCGSRIAEPRHRQCSEPTTPSTPEWRIC